MAEKTKICKRCKIEKPVSLFAPRHDTKGKYRAVCKNCCLIAEMARIREKQKWFWEKVGAYCRHCGYDKTTTALQIHHLYPHQKKHKFDSLGFWARKMGWERFKEKVAQPDYMILCANCHITLHAGEWSTKRESWNDGAVFQGEY